MQVNQYLLGNTTQINVSITNALTNALVDPSSLTLIVDAPTGITTYTYGIGATIVKSSVGQYYANIVLNVSGTWLFRWAAGGTNPGATESTINVYASQVISG